MITIAVELTTKKAVLKKSCNCHWNWSVKPVSDTAADQYTDSSSEEEGPYVDVNFDDPIDLAIN